MKRLITLASILAVTAAPTLVFAGNGAYEWTQASETIHGGVAGSKEAAYDMGRAMMQSYQNKSSGEQSDEFRPTRASGNYVDRSSFTITDSNVRVDEYLTSDGQIVYKPILKVTYAYRMRETGMH